MACLPTATYSAPGVSLYAALGGGGGGSSGSQISSSGAYVLCSTNGVLVLGNLPGTFQPDIQIGDANNTIGISLENSQGDSLTLYNGSIGITTQNVNMTNTNLNVSSINGAAPGGSSFFSTLSVPLPTQTSTVIFSFTPGTWTYNGLGLFSGATEPFNGFVNVISNVSQGVNYGSLFANSNSQPSAGTVPSEMTLNFGDSGLSTIKLICANNSASQTGTWQGAVIKLN